MRRKKRMNESINQSHIFSLLQYKKAREKQSVRGPVFSDWGYTRVEVGAFSWLYDDVTSYMTTSIVVTSSNYGCTSARTLRQDIQPSMHLGSAFHQIGLINPRTACGRTSEAGLEDIEVCPYVASTTRIGTRFTDCTTLLSVTRV